MFKKIIYLTSLFLLLSLSGKGWPDASNPSPYDGATHEDTWLNLSWEPGAYADSFNIYIGEIYEDVKNGTSGTFQGNRKQSFFVIGFPGFTYPEGLVPGTTYYWRIEEVNDLHPDSPWEGDVWSFTVPPSNKAYAPEPADDTLLEDPWATLSWVPGPNAVSYDIYLGENYDDVEQGTGSTFQGNQSKPSFVVGFPGFPYPDGLAPGTTYYWRVDEVNDLHLDSPWIGDVWSFTVLSDTTDAPSPADGALHEDTWAFLSWVPGPNAVSYDIYLGENYDDVKQGTGGTFQGNQSKLSFVVGFPGFPYPDGLVPGTTYYWRVDEVNDLHPDSPWIGDVWSFMVPPSNKAYAPKPADGALHEDTWATLSWAPGPNAVSYDIYLGENYDDVEQGTGSTFQGNQSEMSFVVGFPGFPYPDGLVPGTTYYWRIDEVNDLHPDSPWIGDVWSFTVLSDTTDIPSPADGALLEETWVIFRWEPGPNLVSYDIYLGENYEEVKQGTGGTFQGNQSKLSFVVGFPGFPYPDGLVPGTTYYWRIDEVDSQGNTTTGDIWTFRIIKGPLIYVDAGNRLQVGQDSETNNKLEDGTELHPFNDIWKAIDAADDGSTILVKPGIYSKLDFKSKAITIAGFKGSAVINTSSVGQGETSQRQDAVTFHAGEGPGSVLKNFIIKDSGIAISLNYGSSPTISNITIVDNDFGIAAYENSNPDISNCIFWNNRDGDLFQCQARYSCFSSEVEGIGNISSDPLFVDVASGDYHLKSEGWRWSITEESWIYDNVTSPCIDAGNPDLPLGDEPMSVPRDPDNIYGVNRYINMGAFGGTAQASMPPPG